jgi:hypothetical protein
MLRRSLSFFLSLLGMILLGTSDARAQSSGSVRGTVTDSQGAAVPNAKVVLTNLATNALNETQTNNDGLFVFGYVTPAKYNLSIKKDGFRTTTADLTVEVAQVVSLNFALEIGQLSESVTVTESALIINTTNGELGHEVSGEALQQMPLLNRNYYNLMQLTAGAADTGSVSGDMRGSSGQAGGGGLAIAGARTSEINYMLDGGENNDTFVAGVAQIVPLDSVQEFKIQTNGMGAEYGRNPVVTNVVTKSGTNAYHGSAYEYYRGASLSTDPFFDKANGIPKANFVRNQFGGSFGGAVVKDKLFYFGTAEGVRVRSRSTQFAYVPTQAFLEAANPDVTTYMNAWGGLPASDCGTSSITAQYIVENVEQSGAYGGSNVLTDQSGSALAAGTNLLCRAPFTSFADVGGGTPQDTWLATGRVDYVFSSNTNLFVRYAYSDLQQPVGAGSSSAYPIYNTPASQRNQNFTLALNHVFSPSLFGELRATYNRVNTDTPLGEAPGTAPCWQYAFGGPTPTADSITFPGYVPTVCAFASVGAGGPQNVYQFQGSVTKSRGRHTFKFGGSYFHMRFNYHFGAFENGYYESESMQDMLNGQVDVLFQALDPRGHVPGDTYDTSVDGPFQFPQFGRHYHYNEFAFYGEDSYKMTNRLTLSYGLRWEYFGVPHSPSGEQALDANLYLNAIGGHDSNIYEQIRDARFRRTNQFYRPDYGDFGPRVGIAYDLSGHGTTVLRAGYGLYFDRNFGNATFNAIQNPPNYAVLSSTTVDTFGVPLTIAPNEFDMINAVGGSFRVSSSAHAGQQPVDSEDPAMERHGGAQLARPDRHRVLRRQQGRPSLFVEQPEPARRLSAAGHGGPCRALQPRRIRPDQHFRPDRDEPARKRRPFPVPRPAAGPAFPAARKDRTDPLRQLRLGAFHRALELVLRRRAIRRQLRIRFQGSVPAVSRSRQLGE